MNFDVVAIARLQLTFGMDTVPRVGEKSDVSFALRTHCFARWAHHAAQSDEKQDTQGRVE